jgi:hypothetical protein
MASFVWPLDLPQVPQRGYSEELGVSILRTTMDLGPAKLRRRGTRPDVLNVSFLMTSSQVETLENFVENTIKGTARFDFIHPRKLVVSEVRIVPKEGGTYFNLQYAAPGYYTVSLQLEILP